MAVEKIVTCDICGKVVRKGFEAIGHVRKVNIPVVKYGPYDDEFVGDREFDICGTCWERMKEFCRTGGKGER